MCVFLTENIPGNDSKTMGVSGWGAWVVSS
jgi:hypothetical protein